MIGCEDRLRNDLYSVSWGVKLCATSHIFVDQCVMCLSVCVCVCVCVNRAMMHLKALHCSAGTSRKSRKSYGWCFLFLVIGILSCAMCSVFLMLNVIVIVIPVTSGKPDPPPPHCSSAQSPYYKCPGSANDGTLSAVVVKPRPDLPQKTSPVPAIPPRKPRIQVPGRPEATLSKTTQPQPPLPRVLSLSLSRVTDMSVMTACCHNFVAELILELNVEMNSDWSGW